MLPYLLGEKTPVNDPLARGAIVGLHAGHGRGHLFRAVLESFAYGVRHHLEVLGEHGVRPARARVTNGGAASQLWKQIVADVTGLVLEPVVNHPGSALGAAFAAGMGTGAFADWSEVARFVVLGDPVLPRSELAPVYDERYRAYRALYAAVREA
jgi:xylulokinase